MEKPHTKIKSMKNVRRVKNKKHVIQYSTGQATNMWSVYKTGDFTQFTCEVQRTFLSLYEESEKRVIFTKNYD